MTRNGYLLALAAIVTAALIGKPGLLLAAGVALAALCLVHTLTTSPDNPRKVRS